ncbi:hypothetical protein V6N13_147014 [Hibiscus sabdariffa]
MQQALQNEKSEYLESGFQAERTGGNGNFVGSEPSRIYGHLSVHLESNWLCAESESAKYSTFQWLAINGDACWKASRSWYKAWDLYENLLRSLFTLQLQTWELPCRFVSLLVYQLFKTNAIPGEEEVKLVVEMAEEAVHAQEKDPCNAFANRVKELNFGNSLLFPGRRYDDLELVHMAYLTDSLNISVVNGMYFHFCGLKGLDDIFDPSTTLLEFLRSPTSFKSVKLGCSEGLDLFTNQGRCDAYVVLLSKYEPTMHDKVDDFTQGQVPSYSGKVFWFPCFLMWLLYSWNVRFSIFNTC